MTTKLYSFSNSTLMVTQFSRKELAYSFLLHCNHRDLPAGQYTYTVYKAGHTDGKKWESLAEHEVWLDPSEGADEIYSVIKEIV